MTHPFDPAAFADSTGDAIVAAGADGVIVYWNQAAVRIFGHAADEAVGHPLEIIIPERLRARHSHGFAATLASGETRYATDLLRVPALHKDGRALSIAFTVTLMHSSADNARIIVATIRDETARWNEERALKRRITELEAHVTKR